MNSGWLQIFPEGWKEGRAAMIVTACVNLNPVMIYFGQELGERGMDEEGFSGRDGRTSIFDYWSVDTIRRWNNNGRWDGALLTDEERELKGFYADLLTLCNRETALSNGLFYDLMPANYENMAFDSTRQFAFLRGSAGELILVIANFDDHEVEVEVNIPPHAYDFRSTLQRELQPCRCWPAMVPVSFLANDPVRVKVAQTVVNCTNFLF